MYSLSSEQFTNLSQLIAEKYPDFESFEEPGLMGEHELDYKHKALQKWERKGGETRD